MKSILFAFLCFLSIFQYLHAQQFPFDFEDSQYTFTGFSGSSFSQRTDPAVPSNSVGQFFNDGSQLTQGFFTDLSVPVNLAANQNVTLRFYAFDPNVHTVLLKLENGTQPAIEVSRQTTAGAGAWTDMTFDFTNATQSGTANQVSATGMYSRVTVFIDFGVNTPGTYLIDDINNGATFTPPNPIDVVYTDLVWSDEFNTPGTNNPVDPTKWFHQTQLPAGGSWFNGEQQHYTNRLQNSYVENGFLNIVARRESFTDQGQTKQFTSARLNSKYAFTYGRVDVRARLPFGAGTWPAIWTLGKNTNEDGAFWDSTYGTTNWPLSGEIDIMEHGLGPVNQVSAALHTACNGCSGNTRNKGARNLQDVANDFHIYSVNWSPQQITFLIDDVPFYTYNPAVKNVNTYPFYEDQYMLLNVAMGGIAGAIDPNFTQGTFQIDYVRVYQNTLSVATTSSLNARIYPNPTSDILSIRASETIDSIMVFNMLGQQVLEKTTDCNTLDVSPFVNGTYILKIQAGDLIQTEKVVVMH